MPVSGFVLDRLKTVAVTVTDQLIHHPLIERKKKVVVSNSSQKRGPL